MCNISYRYMYNTTDTYKHINISISVGLWLTPPSPRNFRILSQKLNINYATVVYVLTGYVKVSSAYQAECCYHYVPLSSMSTFSLYSLNLCAWEYIHARSTEKEVATWAEVKCEITLLKIWYYLHVHMHVLWYAQLEHMVR